MSVITAIEAEAETTAIFTTESRITELSHDADLMREILAPAPHGLGLVKAELLFLEDQYVFHWKTGNQEHYKFLDPGQVKAAFAKHPVDSGYLPKHTLRWGSGKDGEFIVQYIPASICEIMLARDDRSSAVDGLTIPLPPMVFAATGRNYFVWAVKENWQEFDFSSPAFCAPLPNVNKDGLICMGNNALPETSSENLPGIWNLFLRVAPFGNHYLEVKSQSYPKDVRQMLRKLDLTPRLTSANGAIEESQLYPNEDELMLAPRTYPLSDLVPIVPVTHGKNTSKALSIGTLVDNLIVR